MRRRSVLVGAGVLGASVGIGTGLWHGRTASGSASETPAPAPVDIWTLSFQSLSGGAVAMQSLRGQPLLLNFWATWCVPCVVEMPLLDAFQREPQGKAWKILALAVDDAEHVRQFVQQRQLTLPLALAGADGLDLSRQLGNMMGALPFTVVFDSAGKLVQHKLGAVDAVLLQQWAASTR